MGPGKIEVSGARGETNLAGAAGRGRQQAGAAQAVRQAKVEDDSGGDRSEDDGGGDRGGRWRRSVASPHASLRTGKQGPDPRARGGGSFAQGKGWGRIGLPPAWASKARRNLA